jgi:hypothetical protein
MMMPQQMQMPPMPAGLSMANFVRRMFSIISFIILHLFKIIICLAPIGGIPFLAPPPTFPPMGFNGPRF